MSRVMPLKTASRRVIICSSRSRELLRCRAVPGDPFVDDELDGVNRDLFGEACSVVDHGVDALAFAKSSSVDGIELEGVTFSFEPVLSAATAEIHAYDATPKT